MSYKIINKNAFDALKEMPDESIDCVITSPPYYGLRSYKGADIIWGGNPECEHDFMMKTYYTPPTSDKATLHSKIDGLEKKWKEGFCQKCGAWRGQLGLEPTFQMYIDHLMMITREIKRVLKKTGTVFWNMGDSYASSGGPTRHRGYFDPKWKNGRNGSFDEPTSYEQGIPPK
jgi:DNA modification methylase